MKDLSAKDLITLSLYQLLWVQRKHLNPCQSHDWSQCFWVREWVGGREWDYLLCTVLCFPSNLRHGSWSTLAIFSCKLRGNVKEHFPDFLICKVCKLVWRKAAISEFWRKNGYNTPFFVLFFYKILTLIWPTKYNNVKRVKGMDFYITVLVSRCFIEVKKKDFNSIRQWWNSGKVQIYIFCHQFTASLN